MYTRLFPWIQTCVFVCVYVCVLTQLSHALVSRLTMFAPCERRPYVYSRAVVDFGASSLSRNRRMMVVLPWGGWGRRKRRRRMRHMYPLAGGSVYIHSQHSYCQQRRHGNPGYLLSPVPENLTQSTARTPHPQSNHYHSLLFFSSNARVQISLNPSPPLWNLNVGSINSNKTMDLLARLLVLTVYLSSH